MESLSFPKNSSTVISDSKKSNIARIASPEELEGNQLALEAFEQMFSTDTFTINAENAHYFTSSNTLKQLKNKENIIRGFKVCINDVKSQQRLKHKAKNASVKCKYNRKINELMGILAEDSPFKMLLCINQDYKYVAKKKPRQKARVDFWSPMEDDVLDTQNIIREGGFVLRTNGPKELGGGRTEFDSAVVCLAAMKAALERCVDWKEHVESVSSPPRFGYKGLIYGQTDIKLSKMNGMGAFKLKIPLQGTNFWVYSDCPRIRHILCNGNPPRVDKKIRNKELMKKETREFVLMYPHYAEFLRLVDAQFKQIVRNSHNNDLCPYTIIPCCRIQPVCSGETYCIKQSRGGAKVIKCMECEMELCTGGCGRISHGDSPCEVSLDEASEELIQNSSKSCPNPECNVQIHKSSGCNHMTCSRCRTEFCWICGDELPRDEHGHYSTVMHYRPGDFGVGRVGGCSQFDD